MDPKKTAKKNFEKLMDNLPQLQPKEEADILFGIDQLKKLPEQKANVVESCLGKREKKESTKKCDCC